MKSILVFLSFLFVTVLHAQADLSSKPHVIVNDTLTIVVKHPVFIVDSTLYVRSAETNKVLTFSTKDVNFISENCFYHRLSEGQKNHLTKSNAAKAFVTVVLLSSSVVFTSIGIVYLELASIFQVVKYFYTPIFLIAGVGCAIPAALLIRSMIIHKRMSRMYKESKGIRLTQSPGNENNMESVDLIAHYVRRGGVISAQ
jgi:hypothetical protein